jgi:hypothetical protein
MSSQEEEETPEVTYTEKRPHEDTAQVVTH